jgi:hypothetical protein
MMITDFCTENKNITEYSPPSAKKNAHIFFTCSFDPRIQEKLTAVPLEQRTPFLQPRSQMVQPEENDILPRRKFVITAIPSKHFHIQSIFGTPSNVP